MKKVILTVLTMLLILPIAACTRTASADVVKSNKERITSPSVPGSDLTLLIEGNVEFAFDIYQALKSEDGNLFYSPHSISLALAMAYAGARGETERQMADTLNFNLSQDKLHPTLNYLDIELAKRGESAQGKDDKGFRLNIVNALWGQTDYEFQSEFLDTLAVNYGAGLRVLDYINETEKSRVTINNWVEKETEGRIKDLIPQGAIDELTRLVLTNAIYFNAAWLHTFNDYATADGAFYLIDGTQISVPMMKQTEYFGYTTGNGYKSIELPYDGSEMSMVIMLPDTGNFEGFENNLNAQQMQDIIENQQHSRVNLTMPKFEFESEFGLNDILSDMGMPIAFTEDADFTGISTHEKLLITDVIHKAFVAVDEDGTEAAAATAVIVGTTSAPIDEPIDFTIDRPFIFLIRDIETGAILFLGRVMNPVD